MAEAPVVISDTEEDEKESVSAAAAAAVRKSSRIFAPPPTLSREQSQIQSQSQSQSRQKQQPTVVQMFNSDSDDNNTTRDEIFGSSSLSSSTTLPATNTATTSQIRAKRLADLFRPPHAIMFSGTFELARRRARETGRWLLVTVHVPTEFPCQAMNRDLWNEELLQSFIQENFIFLQINAGSQEYQRYESFYPFDGLYPHTALIDPRTGERVETLLVSSIEVSGFKVVGIREIMEILSEFLGEHPLERASQKRQNYSEIASGSTEPEAEAGEQNTLKKSSVEIGSSPTPTTTTPSTTTTAPSTTNASASDLVPEYTGPDSVLIQFRLPDGRRQRHRFDPKAFLSTVFSVAASLANNPPGSFKLMRGEGELMPEEGVLIGDAKLNNTMLTIMK